MRVRREEQKVAVSQLQGGLRLDDVVCDKVLPVVPMRIEGGVVALDNFLCVYSCLHADRGPGKTCCVAVRWISEALIQLDGGSDQTLE